VVEVVVAVVFAVYDAVDAVVFVVFDAVVTDVAVGLLYIHVVLQELGHTKPAKLLCWDNL